MAIERELALRVDTERMPNLSIFPSDEIEQTYFTPYSSIPLYPETDKAEWRVRKITDSSGNISFMTTLKFGEKTSGSRTEIETEIDKEAFGKPVDIDQFAFASLLKRRFYLGNGLVVDQFLHSSRGSEYQAEKEFSLEENQQNWGCPDWLTVDDTLVSNRQRAIELKPKYANGMYSNHNSEFELIASINAASKPIIVTVSGLSGSGKSTIARNVNEKLNGVHIDTDMLHIGVTELKKRYGSVNHDLVGTYDYKKAAQAALRLSKGETVHMPVYEYSLGEPTGEIKVYEPSTSRNVVVDGLYASETARYLRQNETRVIAVFVDTPLYVSLIRRMLRDCSVHNTTKESAERKVNFTPEESLEYLTQTAIPTYLKAEYDKQFDYIVGK